MRNKTLWSVLIFILSFASFLFSSAETKAQVVINEFSPNSDPRGYGDWIELYIFENADLSEYYLTHVKGDGSEGSIDIPEPYEYGPDSVNGQFKVIFARNYLDNDGDRIRLYKRENLTPIDDISYGDKGGICIPSPQGSIGRLFQDGIEGTNLIERFSNTTQGLSNKSNILDACPSPTLQPTDDTPTSTSTSYPTPLLTPTKTPSPTKSPTPTPKPTNTPTKISENNLSETIDNLESVSVSGKELVLGYGARDNNQFPLESKASSNLEEGKKKSSLFAFLIMAVGLLLLFVGFFPFVKRRFGRVKFEDGQRKG